MAREARLERMRRRPLEHELRRLERLRAVAIEEGAFATPYFDRMIAAARHELEAPVVVNPAELDEASIGLGDIDAGDG